ncbi:MAG: N-acetylneuraminate synthase family protein [Candidatus Thorarchaeota archaeon]|jgi:sialic acid synthase SpsE
MRKPFTIAELGSNPAPFHKARLETYLGYAHLAGADAVKVQLFRADHFPLGERPAKRKVEFPRELFEWFVDRARFYRLRVGASVFDKDAIDLCTRLGTDFIKLATREQSNRALRQTIQEEFKGTIFRSIDITRLDFPEPRLPREVTLGCVPRYPTSFTPSLSYVMRNKLSKLLPEPWGWSSHIPDIGDARQSTLLGARAIEKHLKVFESDNEGDWSINVLQWQLMERMLKCL